MGEDMDSLDIWICRRIIWSAVYWIEIIRKKIG